MSEKPKQKQWFLITIEGNAPVSVQFRAFAEDEDQAFDMFEKGMVQMDGRPQIDVRRIHKRKVSIKNLLNGLISWTRQF